MALTAAAWHDLVRAPSRSLELARSCAITCAVWIHITDYLVVS
ncbi:hypothetical protein SNOG_04237 [Parastagonospora nodorum SN15]|uniref:Uncharacterized protein n=1 Tax=Phaeosphaeria nodorum (strain SN15 / ATCC MYA-4574 / FGSC 10173) TaxID=321614 RepID=Q0UVH7_PHANO|nr:hypothetical protein SNOG_04237 [Parastagonospora nodorum SN15]EAT87997.1 hypothetical protein SNOG_04237 [Parastagonospora nodorum SN15]